MTSSTEQDTKVRDFRRVSGSDVAPVVRPMRRPLRQRLRLPLMLAGPIVVVLAGGWWYLTTGRYVSTDDAYVQAARTMISTDVSGRVIAVEVHDNQQVARGQVLFRLDPTTFQINVEEAQASLAAAKLQVDALKATYRQKMADAKAAEDTLAYQQREFDRQKRLLGSGVASQAQFDQAQNGADLARQKLAAAQHDIANTLAQLGGNPNIPADQHPMVQGAQAKLDKVKVDLKDTVIRAPQAGIVTKVEQLQVGDYITAATPVFSMMSHNVWVEANFKETELTHMRPGQTATVEIDTYPDDACNGKVESLSPGAGNVFSLLPPENATGNWVKVVQRLPVRLALDCRDTSLPLHAGLSATVEVDTHFRHPWLIWLDNAVGRVFGSAQAGETRR